MMRTLKDDVLLCLIYLAAFFAEFLLIGILVYVFVKGFPQMSLYFLTTVTSIRQAAPGDTLRIHVTDGIYTALVKERREVKR